MIRMQRTELDMLDAIAAADGLYRTDVIRLLVRREHAKRFGKASKKTKAGAQ